MCEITLSSITTESVQRPDKLLIHGVEGVGKTTFGSKFKKPLFICTEDGLNKLDIAVARFPSIIKNWIDFSKCLSVLAKEKHDYKSLVIDTIDWTSSIAKEHLLQTQYYNLLSKFQKYGSGYIALFNLFFTMLRQLDYLNSKKGMTIILLAHSQINTFKNPSGEDYDRYQPKLPDSQKNSLSKMVKEWADMVLFANYDTSVEDGKATSKNRVLYTSHSPSFDAKNRHGLPARIPLNYSVFQNLLNKNKSHLKN